MIYAIAVSILRPAKWRSSGICCSSERGCDRLAFDRSLALLDSDYRFMFAIIRMSKRYQPLIGQQAICLLPHDVQQCRQGGADNSAFACQRIQRHRNSR